jgi:hypothetical protein
MSSAGAELETRSLTLAKSSSLDALVTLRVSSLTGPRPRRPLLDLVQDPSLRLAGVQQDGPSDLYVVVQLWADNKALCIPTRTAHKAFSSSYTCARLLSRSYARLRRSADGTRPSRCPSSTATCPSRPS